MVWQIHPDTRAIYSPGVRVPDEGPDGNHTRGGQSFYNWVVLPLKKGRPLQHPERMPTVGYIPKPRGRFGSIMSILDQFGVTAKLKQFIEEWDPGVHEFYPIKLIAKSTGEELPDVYYVLNICNLLQSVNLNSPGIKVKQIGDRRSWQLAAGGLPVTFRSEVICGKHIWRDEGSTTSIFASDEFVTAFEKARFKGLSKLDYFNQA